MFVDEVVLQKTRFSISRFRWLRQTLILWGCALMVAAKGLAVVRRDVFRAYGYPGEHVIRSLGACPSNHHGLRRIFKSLG